MRLISAAFLSALASAQDLQNVVDVMPGFVVSDSEGTKYGILTLKTAWKKAGEGENASVNMGLYILAVGDDGVYNFHKNCIWEIAMSKDIDAEEAEIQAFYLYSNNKPYDKLAYGIANVNVSSLNDPKDEEATNHIWKLSVDKSYSYGLSSNSAPVPWTDETTLFQTPIQSGFWKVGTNLSRRQETTRTWQMYLERPLSQGGVADIKTGGTAQGRIWYKQGSKTIWTQDAAWFWGADAQPRDRGDGGKTTSDLATTTFSTVSLSLGATLLATAVLNF